MVQVLRPVQRSAKGGANEITEFLVSFLVTSKLSETYKNVKLSILTIFIAALFARAQEKNIQYFTLDDTAFQIGSVYQIDSIEFDFDGHGLRPNSKSALTKVLKFLALHPNLIVEIGTHTDERGNDQYNLRLSEMRAMQIVDYLQHKGIPIKRLIPKGYGETKPYIVRPIDNYFEEGIRLTGPYLRTISNRDTSEVGHQMNRRSEMKILALNFVDTFDLFVDTFPPVPKINESLFKDSSGWSKKPFPLHGIVYEFDSPKLRPQSRKVLEKLVGFLQVNDTLIIEISNHSDCRGNDHYGTNLTERRARVVVDYLVQQGISEKRLVYKGYGETQPAIFEGKVLSCDYIFSIEDLKERELYHQANRRTEFRIISTDFKP